MQAAYRALGAEEPPRALDEAILRAARRPSRTWVQRWSVPVSLAAVVVLSVVVTLRIQHEQPGIEQAPVQEKRPAGNKTDPRPAPAPAAPAQDRKEAVATKPVPPSPAAAQPFPSAAQDKAAEPSVAAAPAAGAASAEGSLSRGVADVARAPAARPAPAAARIMSAEKTVQGETPEQELERIAKLRAEGRHDEADKALAEFRKRLPDYRIPDALLLRIERR
jgi:hypothetical protein